VSLYIYGVCASSAMMTAFINRLDALLESGEMVQPAAVYQHTILHWTYPRCVVKFPYDARSNDLNGIWSQTDHRDMRIQDVYVCTDSVEAYFTFRYVTYRVSLTVGLVVGVADIWKLGMRDGDVILSSLTIKGVSYPMTKFMASFPWQNPPSLKVCPGYRVEEMVCNF
jgi:hypothetical protein